MDLENKKTTSAYNEATFQTQRLHYNWLNSNSCKKGKDLYGWNDYLTIILDELVGSIAKVNNLSVDSWFESDNYKRVSLLDSQINLSLKFNKRGAAFQLLRKKEQLIRIIQEEVGKGGRYVDPEDQEF